MYHEFTLGALERSEQEVEVMLGKVACWSDGIFAWGRGHVCCLFDQDWALCTWRVDWGELTWQHVEGKILVKP